MSDENVEREKAWSEFVSNNGLTYAAEQQLRVAFIGGWVRGRASRPREAAVAPEACPVAWQVVSAHDGYSWGVFDRSNGGEWEATEVAKRGPYRVIPLYAQPPREAAVAPEACPRCPACGATEWFNVYSYKSTDGQGHPLKVWTDSAGDGDRAECRDKWHVEEREIEGIVERTIQKIPAMLAQPASATAEGGGGGIVAHTPLPRGLVLWQHDETGRTMVLPEAKDPCFGWRRVTPPATPASAAGREGAVEKVVEAAKALLKNRGATYSVGTIPPSRYVMIPIAYFDALLAAEAAERGEKEA